MEEKQCISVAAPQLWNFYPKEVRLILSLVAFVQAVKHFTFFLVLNHGVNFSILIGLQLLGLILFKIRLQEASLGDGNPWLVLT